MFEQFGELELNTFNSVFEVTFGVLVAFSTFLNYYINEIKRTSLSRIRDLPNELTIIEQNLDMFLKQHISMFDHYRIKCEINKQWQVVKNLQAIINDHYLFSEEFSNKQKSKDTKTVFFEKQAKKNRNYLGKGIRSKFSALLEISIAYTFIILVLSGFDDGSKILYLNVSNSYTIVESFDKIIIKTLFFLNPLVTGFLIHLFLRQYRSRGFRKNKYKLFLHRKIALTGVPTIILSLLFLVSVGLALITGDFLSSPGIHIFTILFTIVNTLLTLFLIVTWSTIGISLKYRHLSESLKTLKEVIDEMSTDVMTLHLKKQSIIIRSQFERVYLTDYHNDKLRALGKSRRTIFYEKVLMPRKYRLIIVAVLLIGIFWVAPLFVHISNPQIESLIINQGREEIESYYRLPEIDTTWFDKFFIYNAPIRKRIYNSLIRHNNQGLVLNYAEKLSNKHMVKNLKYLEKEGDTLYVETSEYWYLRWYSAKKMDPQGGYMTPVYYPQYYTLVKDSSSNWKIYDIEYFGVSF